MLRHASTIALDRAVEAYDRTTADSVSKQLLLNIARARQNLPIHFTAIANIAATYRWTLNAGFGGALTGDRGGLLVPLVSANAEENPTISIAPMQGDEFMERLLTPFPEQKLSLLLRQGYDVDAQLLTCRRSRTATRSTWSHCTSTTTGRCRPKRSLRRLSRRPTGSFP